MWLNKNETGLFKQNSKYFRGTIDQTNNKTKPALLWKKILKKCKFCTLPIFQTISLLFYICNFEIPYINFIPLQEWTWHNCLGKVKTHAASVRKKIHKRQHNMRQTLACIAEMHWDVRSILEVRQILTHTQKNVFVQLYFPTCRLECKNKWSSKISTFTVF